MAQAYLYGDSLKSSAVAIIVPDEEAVSAWAKENNVSGSFAELCTNDVRLMSLLVLEQPIYMAIFQSWFEMMS